MGVSIQCLLPEDWQSDGDYLRHTAVLDVPPCCQRQFRLRLKAPNRERAVGFAEIRTFVGGDLLTALPLHLETVSEVAFGEIANYAELWQQASPTGTWPSPVPGTIHNGPRGVTITGTAARKLTVDLDATPIVELQLESGGSDWFCYLTDGRSVPTLLELNVGGSGLLTYDMVRATGWQGLRRFSFCLHVVRGEVLVRSMRFRPR